MDILLWAFEIVGTYIEGYLLLVLTGILLREENVLETRRKEIWIASIETLGVTFSNFVQLVSVFPIFVMMSVMLILQKVLLKRKFFFSCMIAGIYIMMVTMIDYFVAYFATIAFHVKFDDLMQDVGYRRMVCILLSKGLLIIIIEMIRYFSLELSNIRHRKNTFILLTVLIFTSLPFVMLLNYTELYHLGITFLWILVAFIIAVILLIKYIVNNERGYQQELFLELQNAKNDMLENSLRELEKSFAIWKSSVHDYKHAILYMEHLISENRIEELQQYLHKENKKLEQSSHYYKTGNSMLDVIVNTKYKLMQEKNILFMSDIVVSEKLPIAEIDLGILLGNLLDNAIEAAQACKTPYISLVIKYHNSLLEMEITNSYTGEQSSDFRTTKEDKLFHGIGLKSVENIVERYEGFMEKQVEEEVVTVKIEMPC